MKKMMLSLASLLAILGLVFVIGLLMPNQREFVKMAKFSSPPKKVFETVTDVGAQTDWRSDVRQIQVLDEKTWTEVPKKGTPITFRTKEKVAHSLFEIEIMAPENLNGYWVGTFEKNQQNGTNVVFKEVITISNPFYRVFSHLFIDLDEAMDLYISDLKAQLGE